MCSPGTPGLFWARQRGCYLFTSALTWMSLSWLERELCFIWSKVCCILEHGRSQFISRVLVVLGFIPNLLKKACPCVTYQHLCCVIRNSRFQNANMNTFKCFFILYFGSLNVANTTVINVIERDSLKDVNIHQSLMICIWIQKIGLWLHADFLSLWFSHGIKCRRIEYLGFSLLQARLYCLHLDINSSLANNSILYITL